MATAKSAGKKAAPKKSTPKKIARKVATKKSSLSKSAAKNSHKKWSGHVTETSDAMDLDKDIFKSNDPKKIAISIKNSTEKSESKKADPFQSAKSMINFYENRAGKNLAAAKKKVLDKSKEELRILFGREEE